MIKTGLTEEELERSALLLNGLLADSQIRFHDSTFF